jgi:autophagy-related protein 2
MHSVLQLVQGLKDLVLMPVEQYQKDGRILRGLQRGAHSFTSSTAMSLLDFTNRVLGVIKFAAELAFDIMSPEGTVVQVSFLIHLWPKSLRLSLFPTNFFF